MAQVVNTFSFTGRLGPVTAYRMRGHDKIILRTKGGPSRNAVKNSPRFELTRRNNSEFGGRSAASKRIMRMLWPQKALADYNFAGTLNALMKPIQLSDLESELGSRSIMLSKNPRLLEGFNLNRNHPFDSIVRCPVSNTLLRDTLTARIGLPALIPGINFFVPGKYPLYRFLIVLGIVPDLFQKDQGYKPSHDSYDNISYTFKETAWYPASQGSPAAEAEISIPATMPDTSFSVMLSIGICFGTMGANNNAEQIKYAGSAKILAMS